MNLSEEQNQQIVCGRHNIEYKENNWRDYWEGYEVSGGTSKCILGEIDYKDYDHIEIYEYEIICCVDKYCYKYFETYEWEDYDGIHIEYDYTFSDYHWIGCYLKTLKCGNESIE